MIITSGGKAVTDGTHRAVAPEQTWARIRPMFGPAGITRVADVTRLDTVGIPVYQAVRPASLNISVSQGKGVTPLLARISAAMEALELWHAEVVAVASERASVRDVRNRLGFDPFALPLHHPHVLDEHVVVDWVAATVVGESATTLVPRDLVELDLSVRDCWAPPMFVASSNGLASGNTVDEALLHGMYELIERDALARHHSLPISRRPQIALESVTSGWPRALLDCMERAQLAVTLYDLTGPTGVACFEAVVHSALFPLPCRGSGAHLDRTVALCRALTEAAQSRLTQIAGARDDLLAVDYARTDEWVDAPVARTSTGGSRPFTEVVSGGGLTLADDVDDVRRRIQAMTGGPVLAVDLSRPEVALPVVRVLAPGMQHPTD